MKEIVRKFLIEQMERFDNWIEISETDYLKLLDKYDSPLFVYKHLTRNPEDRDKKIKILGNLDVSNLPIKKLSGIGYVEGSLNISQTEISDVSDIKYKYLYDYDSPHERIRIKRETQRKLGQAQGRRDDAEWDINNPDIDETGILANAIIEYIRIHKGDDHIKTPEDLTRLDELSNQMESLLAKEKEYEESGRDTTDIFANIEVTEDEITTINNKIDVYNIIPDGSTYRLTSFEILGSDEYNGWTFAAGTQYEADKSLSDYFDEWIDKPTEYLSMDTLENYIDEDAVLDVMREHYEYDISESPESYFDNDDFELSDEQEEELARLELELSKYQDELSEYEDKLLNVEDSDSAEYEQVEEHIDSLNELISDIEEKISDIEPDNEPTQEMIDDKVDELLNDVSKNIISYMQDFGMSIENYLDVDELRESLVSDSDYGALNGWDSSYDEVRVGDEYYIVMVTGK